MNYKKALRRKYRKQRDKFIAEHELKTVYELPLSVEDIADAVEFKRIIYVEFGGKKRFPTFQFDSDGRVYETLQAHLPRLLTARSAWDICFWLFTEQSVTLKRAVPNAARLRDISVQEMLGLGKRAAELTERYIGRPVDAVTSANYEVFSACVEHLLNPDYRVIPAKTVDWDAYFDSPTRATDDFSKD